MGSGNESAQQVIMLDGHYNSASIMIVRNLVSSVKCAATSDG